MSEMIFGALWNCRADTDRNQRNPEQSTAETADFRQKYLKNIEKCKKNGAKHSCGHPIAWNLKTESQRRMEREVPPDRSRKTGEKLHRFLCFFRCFLRKTPCFRRVIVNGFSKKGPFRIARYFASVIPTVSVLCRQEICLHGEYSKPIRYRITGGQYP